MKIAIMDETRLVTKIKTEKNAETFRNPYGQVEETCETPPESQ